MAAELKIGIGADNSELNKSLQDAEKRISAFVDKVGQIGALGDKIAGIGTKLTVGVTLPLIAAGKAAYDLAADFEDAMGATSQIFKNASDDVKNWADKLPSYYGIAEKEALDYSNMMGSMLKNIGGLTDKEASKQSAKLIELAGDLTSMYGGTTADAVHALTGALKGNNTMLDNYGMAASDALVKAKALEMGLISQGQEMSLTSKQAATLALIYEQSGAAQGQAAREANGASGSMRALRTEIKNLGTELGSFLLPMIAPLTAGIKSMVEGFRELDPSIQKTIVVVAAVAAAAGPLLLAVGGFMSMLPTLLSGLGAVKVAFAALTGPIGLVTLAIVGVVTAVVANWSKITPYLVRTANNFIQLYNESQTFRGGVLTIGFAFESLYAVIKSFAISAYNTLKSFGKGVLNLFEGVSLMIRGAFNMKPEMIAEGWAKANEKVALSFDDLGARINAVDGKYNRLLKNEKLKFVTEADLNVSGEKIAEKTEKAVINGVTKGVEKANEKIKDVKIELPDIEPIEMGKTSGFINNLGEQFDTLLQFAVRTDEISNMINNSVAKIDFTPIGEKIKTATDIAAENAAYMKATLTNLANDIESAIGSAIGDTVTDMFSSIGEAIGSGGDVMAAMGQSLLKSLAGFLSNMGKMMAQYGGMLIAYGTAEKVLKFSADPVSKIAAGAALLAIGGAMALVGGAIKGASSSGGGGSASGSAGGGSQSYSSSYSSGGGFGNGGEVVFRISGNDLVGVLSRQQDKNTRLGG